MTRETKIGLLVGLAFIIVVGILLADRASTAADPKAAALTEAGANVRQSVTTPGAQPVVGAETPRAPVPTRADLNPPRDPSGAPVRIVDVGPGAGNSLPPIGQEDAFAKRPTRGGPADLVAQHPDDFTTVGDGHGKPTAPTQPITPPKTYVAESGDTVSRIASKQMPGGNSKANREALIKANPSLQTEGNVVYVGKTYVIPSPGAAAQIEKGVAGKPTTPSALPAPSFTAPTALPNTVWYTVKDNDNLWRIAARELGDGNQWTVIRDLNKDVLRGGETVKANMRIRLPRNNATASVN